MCPILELIQTLKNIFTVTSVALSCAHTCARLLQSLVQSLIGSPSTLVPGPSWLPSSTPASFQEDFSAGLCYCVCMYCLLD